MKLINKISRYFLFTSIPIFVVISIGLYFVIENTLTNETDEQLINISKKVIKDLENGKIIGFAPLIEVSTTDKVEKENQFEDVVLFTQNDDNEGEQYRQLTTFVNLNGTNYKIITRVSLIEKEDMLFTIMNITIAAIFFLVLIMYVTNKFASKKILKDFYDTLKKLENFSIKSDENLILNKSTIEEFEKLNKSILYLAEKAKNEYRSLKEFTEETNHEIQTPLAIAKSKLEILIQNERLNEKELTQVNAALMNLNRLERVNKSILLLNKLEHKELFDSTQINLYDEIINILKDYNDFILSKNISIKLGFDENFIIKANHSLINILLSNLLSNAIKHNIDSGNINIELKNNELRISNTGQITKKNTQKFFERFYKESNSFDSVGLGLTIAKKICDLYDFIITNQTQNNFYSVIVKFIKNNSD